MSAASERRWPWRTWNTLLQVRAATDGEDPRQRSGEMTVRGLIIQNPAVRAAFVRRGWVEPLSCDEYEDEYTGAVRYGTSYAITRAGRLALVQAIADGVKVQ